MSNILTGFNMQGNDPIDDRIVSKSNLETLEQYLKRVPVQKRYYGLTFFALDKNNELRKYTFQTSLINPTIDDNEEEIERIDKELQEHVSDKTIHKTSEEIRSEIVDADIPDTIARVQWTLDQINTAVINLIGGASDEYNTLKRIQTKIEELKAKIYGDDGSEVLKTLEQALKFLNQYKDYIVDIPDNFVSKQDIVDNLTTDDPTKVLSAKQGKVLSDTLTNYFESAMQSIRTETDRAINAENRIETKLDKEIDRSIKEDQRIDAKLDAEIKRSTDEDLRIDSKLDSEINRSTTEDDRLDKKIDAETTRATDAESNLNTKIETETDRAEREESRIETKLDNEIARSTNKDTEHDNRLTALEGDTHEQNTDLGTTNSTFQLKYNTGNKIKHESDAISVRNAADTDYVNFIAKNATFKGDLLVEGQSFVTEAETVEIKDNLLLLNKGEVGAGVTKGIAGLEIDRGTKPNYFIVFDESDNRFKAGVEGDLWNLALRESDDNMLDGYFISWNSKDKILSTTNIVNESTPLLFGRTDYKRYSGNKIYQEGVYSSYSFIDETPKGFLYNSAGENDWHIDTSKLNFRFWKPLLGTTFRRVSDNSEVLYHADIVNNLTSGGTNKVLSAEQGKLLQNSITNIQGSYLPLSGGTMTGSIIFPNRKGIFGRLTDGTSNIKIAVVNANNNVEIGNSNTPLMLVSNSTDLTHYRDNNTYKIWDKFNLSDPVTLSGNNTFTGNNTFQAGKFNVGPFGVTSSGSLLLNISSPAGSAWSRNLVFKANNDITSSIVFGGYNSINNTSIGYAYIGIGDVTYSTVQYKFYANSLKVPYKWSIDGPDGSAILWSQTSEIVNLGRAAGTTKIRSGNTDLIHTKGSTEYIIWDKSNLPTPATSTDLANYLPLIGGTLTGQLTIKQSIDIKLRLQSTDADNHCIIQAINSQASQLGVFGYAGDKWAIGHGGTYYEIWDKYNLTNPVTYTTNTYNHATLTNKDGQYFTYIKAGTNGLLPHSKATLVSGGSGSLGTSDQSFNAAYINYLYTNKISFGVNGPYIIGSTSATQFLDANGGVQKVATGGLYVGVSYASDALNLVPTNGIYSSGAIKSAAGFTSNFRQTNLNLAKTGNDVLYISSFVNGATGSPGTDSTSNNNVGDGMFLTYFWQNDNAFQLAADIDGTGIAYRHYTPSTGISTTGWKFLADTNWVVSKINSSTSNYLPLTGGTLSGNLTINTVGSTTFVINNNDTNGSETFMRVLRKGTASAAIGFRDSLGAYIYNYNSNKYLFIDNDGYARVGTTSGSTRLALITDIPSVSGYLPLTGGALTGTLSINSGGSEPLIINNSASAGEAYVVTKTQGTTRGVMGWNSSLGMFLQDNRGYTFSVKADGVYFGASSSTLTKLPTSTDLSGYLPLAGGTLTGALTMSSRRHGVVIDVIGGAGNTWDEGVGALSVQVPNDAGQTPLLLARRSGAAIDTTTAAERLLSMELLDDGHSFIIGMSGSKALQLDWTSNKAGTGKLFGKTIATTDQIPSIPSISISNSGSGNAVTSITASGHTLTVTKGATYLTSSSLDGYATQSWANGQFASLSLYNTTGSYTTIRTRGNEFCLGNTIATSASNEVIVNYRIPSGCTYAPSTWVWRAGSSTSYANGYWGSLYMNGDLVATQTWSSGQFPTKTGTGASGTWGISISGNATTASTASKLGSTTIGGSAKPIYLSSGTPTACSAIVGSATVPVYMNAGTITQCSTTLGVSITGNAATATNATQLGGTAASSYVKANDNISRLTNDSGYTTQEWVNGQGFLTSDSILDKFVPTTGGYIRNSDQVLLRLQRTGFSTGTSRTIEMYFDDSNTDGTSTTPRGSIGYNSEVGMFLYSAVSKKFLAMEYTGRPFYGTPENRYYLLGSNTQYHNLDGYQRIGDIMIQWGYFTVQGNSTRAVNFSVSFTNTVWSVTGSWDNTTTGGQENWGFTNYTSSGFTIINGDGSSRVFHYIAIGPFTRS